MVIIVFLLNVLSSVRSPNSCQLKLTIFSTLCKSDQWYGLQIEFTLFIFLSLEMSLLCSKVSSIWILFFSEVLSSFVQLWWWNGWFSTRFSSWSEIKVVSIMLSKVTRVPISWCRGLILSSKFLKFSGDATYFLDLMPIYLCSRTSMSNFWPTGHMPPLFGPC